MERKDDKIRKGSGMGIGIAIGMACGIAIGVAMDQIAIGIAIGAGIGVSIGAALESKNRELESETGENSRTRKTVIIIIISAITLGSLLYLLFAR